MATKVIKTVFQFRRATTEEWLANKDVKPAAGEPCFDLTAHTLKIGDGETTYENLPTIGGVELKLEADGKSIVLEDNVFKLMGFDGAEVGAQPRVGSDGKLEWVVPSTEIVDGLQSAVTDLQKDVASIQEIVTPSAEGSIPLLDRIENLEHKMDNSGEGSVDAKIDAKLEAFMSDLTDDGKVNTLMELINYVESHGEEAANMVSEISDLKDLVGLAMTKTEAEETLLSKAEAATLQHVKYEISHKPVGTLVNYGEKEIRVMVPADTKWVKQNVGATGNANMYYMGFKAYAPANAVSFKEGDQGVIVDEMFTFDNDFSGIDEYGRKYSICWLALASYSESTDTWTYFGKNSNANKYIGWTYCVEWYDANGVKIESDSIRINLSNEGCHNIIEPYYMSKFVKGVNVGGTMLDVIDGVVEMPVGAGLKGSEEIVVNEDGTLGVGIISFSKIQQAEDEVIVMDGGTAAV